MKDLLIVGAGPTGLMLALWLAENGIHARIVDTKPGPTPETRAVGIQARTLEFWEMLGIVDRMLEQGHRSPGVDMWIGGRQVARLPVSEIGKGMSRYSYIFLLGQDQTERLLYERLKELGGDVEWNTAVTEVDGNEATIDGKIDAYRFILGCDGARSIVRKAAGLEFPGGTYAARFYVADVDATGGVVEGEVNLALFRDRFLAFFPLKDPHRFRLVGLLAPSVDPDKATIQDVQPELEDLMKTRIEKVRWFSVYRVHHRVVDHFRKGPLFLLGDAAHVHSPVGAQGMNTGLGDAVNLGWKLIEVLKHGADERLLDSFEAERKPFAQSLVATTDRLFEFIVRRGMLAQLVRTKIMPLVLPVAIRIPPIRMFIFRTVSQIRISYHQRSLAVGSANGYRAGDRLPPRDGDPMRPDRWRLIACGPEETGAADWCQQRGFDYRKEDGPASVLLVRPDGYIGFVASRFDAAALERYLRETVGRPA